MNNKILLTGILTVLLAGCSSSGTESSRNSVRVVGSSTVYPFATAVAEKSSPTPIIESTGTGGGIKLFCAGIGAQHPDIVSASRKIKDEEVEACKKNGVKEITELQIGLDGIVVAANKSNILSDLSARDIYVALAATPFGKPQTAKTWKDVNPSLPALPISVYGPPSTSGTRDAFNELIMAAGCKTDPAMKELKKSDETKFKQVCESVRTDGAYMEGGENDNLLVQKLSKNPTYLAIFGYGYLEHNLNVVKGINISGVSPTYDNIAAFTYPGARPLFIYVKNAHVKSVRGLRDYVKNFTSEEAIGPKGYLVPKGLITATDKIREESRNKANTL